MNASILIAKYEEKSRELHAQSMKMHKISVDFSKTFEKICLKEEEIRIQKLTLSTLEESLWSKKLGMVHEYDICGKSPRWSNFHSEVERLQLHIDDMREKFYRTCDETRETRKVYTTYKLVFANEDETRKTLVTELASLKEEARRACDESKTEVHTRLTAVESMMEHLLHQRDNANARMLESENLLADLRESREKSELMEEVQKLEVKAERIGKFAARKARQASKDSTEKSAKQLARVEDRAIGVRKDIAYMKVPLAEASCDEANIVKMMEISKDSIDIIDKDIARYKLIIEEIHEELDTMTSMIHKLEIDVASDDDDY